MARDSTIPFTVVVPAYNEQARLPKSLDQLREYLDREFSSNYELIVVNDGSTDKLAGVLEDRQANWRQLKVITHTRNLGKGAALRTGVRSSMGELVLLCDADGATPINQERLLRSEILDGADVAVGSRCAGGRVKRYWVRRIAATLFSRVVRTMLRVGVRDTQCGFKMLRGDIARSLFHSTREEGYLVDLELLILARYRGYHIVETPLTWREMPGSKLSLWKIAIPVAAGLCRLYRRSRLLRKSPPAASRTSGAPATRAGKYRLSAHRTRHAVTLVEVLVAISIFGLLVSLLIPAILAARASARRSQCQSQVQQIAQAVIHHESVHRHFPTGGWTYTWVGDPDRGFGTEQPGGWIYNILSYIEEHSLRELGKHASPTDRANALAKLCQTPISLLVCPDRALPRLTSYTAELPPRNAVPVPRVAKSYYAINAGDWEFGGLGPGPETLEEVDRRAFDWPNASRASGISYQRSRVRTSQILDGTSKTYLVGEKYVYPSGRDIGHDQSMYTGYDYDVFRWTNTGLAPYGQGNVRSFGSSHTPGAHFAFVDGSVHMIRFGIQLRVHQALGNRHDGSEVALPLD